MSRYRLYQFDLLVVREADHHLVVFLGDVQVLAARWSGSSTRPLSASRRLAEPRPPSFDFLHESFPKLDHLRPGNWEVTRISGRSNLAIAKFEQYSHLVALNAAARKDPELAAALGNDYTITPDVIIVRQLEPDAAINFRAALVDQSLARRASLRAINGGLPLLHASISCKWTMRSDRAQNARSEALNLIRNRKGHLPHVVVVTGEPLPTRLASLALGTGDIDCVYHFALPELLDSLETLKMDDQLELLLTMVNGKRLKDIADLPLDLAV